MPYERHTPYKAAVRTDLNGKGEELAVLNVRVPAELHRLAREHTLDTGESMAQLVTRLLRKELQG